jgi:predicted ATP-dependent endonuclease of OLD family
MSLIEVLEILHKHFFSIVANSTNFGATTKIQEFIFLRNKDSHDAARSLPTTDTKTH